MDQIQFTAIGHVHNDIKERMKHGWGKVESRIRLDPELTDSLDGIEDFSHIIVLFWMHRVSGVAPKKVHPQGRQDMPLTGLLATRAPHRPNSIGASVVRLLERSDNELKVRGLDAMDGTPILDIKPYLPKDEVPGAVCPEWVSRLDFS
jgi:tRNA-Thr(GGU) m(6)t(6)A37 methyltransferase TsaA